MQIVLVSIELYTFKLYIKSYYFKIIMHIPVDLKYYSSLQALQLAILLEVCLQCI